MKIIICEDNLAQRKFIYNIIRNHILFHLPDSEIVLSASKGEEVLSYIDKSSVDCYFLDIELAGNIDGLDIAMKIREKDPVASIIFVTTFVEKLRLTFKYKIAALDFIEKNTNSETLVKNILDALKSAHKNFEKITKNNEENTLQIRIGESIRKINHDDIMYFETSNVPHKLRVYLKSGVYEFYGKLKDLENLNPQFCRCHTSYIVNLKYIEEYNVKERIVTIKNGDQCLVSFRYSKKIKKGLSDMKNKFIN